MNGAILMTLYSWPALCRTLWGCGKGMKGTALALSVLQSSWGGTSSAQERSALATRGELQIQWAYGPGMHPGADAWHQRGQRELSRHYPATGWWGAVIVFLARKSHEHTVPVD